MNCATVKPARGYIITSFKPTNYGDENHPPTKKNNSRERSPKSPRFPKDSPFAKKPRKNAPPQAALMIRPSKLLGMQGGPKPTLPFALPMKWSGTKQGHAAVLPNNNNPPNNQGVQHISAHAILREHKFIISKKQSEQNQLSQPGKRGISKEQFLRLEQIEHILTLEKQVHCICRDEIKYNGVQIRPLLPLPLEDYQTPCPGYLLLHHSVHANNGGVPLKVSNKEDYGLPETINNALGISDYVTSKDFEPSGGKGVEDGVHALLLPILKSKGLFSMLNHMNNNNRKKQSKKNQGSLSRLTTFRALLQEKQGIFVVIVYSRVEDWKVKVVKTSWTLNAAAGYLVDHCHGVIKTDHLCQLDDSALNKKLSKQFGWLKLFGVYQVLVKAKAVEEGKVRHQLMPAN